MRTGGILVCRMDSRRLPGKTLRPVLGRPLLWYVLQRCRRCPELEGALVVATTDRPIDDPIVRFCEEHSAKVYRGATDDVAGRVLGAARRERWDGFYRLNGDSPFIDSDLIRRAHRAMEAETLDLVTNVRPRSYPYGVSVELIRTETLDRIHDRLGNENREHVTQYLYQNLDRFRYHNLSRSGRDLSDIRLTVDTEEDFETFRRMAAGLGRPWHDVSYEDAVEFLASEEVHT